MQYHVMTDIRGRMTTKGPEAPAMLGHPDIMVFVLVVFWCVTLCDFVTCYSGCKNSCKYLMYVRGRPPQMKYEVIVLAASSNIVQRIDY